MGPSKNWREFLELANPRGVDYVIVVDTALPGMADRGTQAILTFWWDPRLKTHAYSSRF
jgi:hypothetical protein